MTATLPFATLQDSANSAVMAGLANASVSMAGQTCLAVFDDAYSAGDIGASMMGGMANSQPVLLLDSGMVPAEHDGLEILVNDEAYLIAAVQPDGLGLSRVLLEKVS